MPRLPKNGCSAAKNGCLAAVSAAWQQFRLPRQGPGRNRWAPFAGADGPGRADGR